MTTTKITGCIGTTDASAELGAEVWVDNTLVIDIQHVVSNTLFSHDIDDDLPASHCLKILLKNKKAEHTLIDDQGNITKDARITISDISFDDAKLGQVFIDQAVYTHDFNGTQDEIQDKFYGEMGCNGTVTLEFESPLFIWLLENM